MGRNMPTEAKATIKSHCNRCGGPTNHWVLHKETTTWDEDMGYGNQIWGSDAYSLVMCAGCDSVHLRHESTFSEHDSSDVFYYPPAVSRRTPDWMRDIGWAFGTDERQIVGGILKEVYTALQNDLPRLAIMGIRAALERTMIDKIGDRGTIGANVKAFIEAGHVPLSAQDLFRNTMIEAGHAAMHRGYVPSKEQMSVLLDLTEWLIVSIYVHPDQAAKVAAGIPKRIT